MNYKMRSKEFELAVKSMGLSQYEFAKIAGISQSAICGAKKGRPMRPSNARKIILALGGRDFKLSDIFLLS